MSSDEELKSKKKKSKKNKKEKRERSDDVEEKEEEEQKSVQNELVKEAVEEEVTKKSKKRKDKHRDKSDERDAAQQTEDTEEKLEVHSANNWEEVDLGDEERKKKFLKLMGATKHVEENVDDSHKHYRTKNEIEKINENLEHQFNDSLANKIQHKIHCGIGFSDDKPKTGYSNNSNNNNNNSNVNAEKPNDKYSKYKMSFVKAKD